MNREELIELLKKIDKMAEEGLSGHMWNTLVAIRKEVREALEKEQS